MYICMYVYIYVCMYICMYIYIYMYIYICICMYVHIYMYICMYVCMYVYIYIIYMYICMYVCMYVCIYVCMCVLCGVVVVSWAQGPRSWVQAQLRQFFHLISICLPPAPPVHPAVWLGTWHLLGCKFKAFSHEAAVGLRVPTPLAVRKGLFSCEFLSRLQELCLHGSQCLLSAQASWLCQVRVTA